MTPILLDTHAAIWSASGTARAATARIIDAAAQRGELLLSPITAWEIGMLVGKGRLILAQSVHDYVRALFGQPGVVTAVLTPAIAVEAATLPSSFHGDPADRIIVATASFYGAQIVTRDRAILSYAETKKAVRCVRC